MINPPSDIILDVMRAAQPEKQAKATQRLAALAGGGSPGANSFAALLEAPTRAQARPQTPFQADQARVEMRNRDTLQTPGAARPGDGAGNLRAALPQMTPSDPASESRSASTAPANAPMTPHQEFEAFVLRSFVETMLPDDASAAYGSGTAGEIWKGMKAEHIGNAMARSGGIGIAEKLARLHPAEPMPASQPQTQTPVRGDIEDLFAASETSGSRPALDDAAQAQDVFADPETASLFFAGLWRNGQ
jgi:flagellar protein FlgJ